MQSESRFDAQLREALKCLRHSQELHARGAPSPLDHDLACLAAICTEERVRLARESARQECVGRRPVAPDLAVTLRETAR